MTLKKWEDIKGDFKHALLMGNGASIEFDEKFKYKSLWQKAKETGAINDEIVIIAKDLNTGPNFELLLRKLHNATIINNKLNSNDVFKDAYEQIKTILDNCYVRKEICTSVKKLGIGTNFGLLLEELDNITIINNKFNSNDAIKDAYEKVRKALIDTIGKVHCEYCDVSGRFNKRIPFLKNFKTIFSLNYDLLIYWMMLFNNGTHTFKDCFNERKFSDRWRKYEKPIRGDTRRTLVFYPHGALHLARSKQGAEEKIIGSGREKLLETIRNTWSSNSYLPLFVADGDSNMKRRSIERSSYLSTVYDEILPESGPTLVIYGWSMGETDKHILKQIIGGNYEKIAVHVHPPSVPETQDINEFIDETKKNLKKGNVKDVICFKF